MLQFRRTLLIDHDRGMWNTLQDRRSIAARPPPYRLVILLSL